MKTFKAWLRARKIKVHPNMSNSEMNDLLPGHEIFRKNPVNPENYLGCYRRCLHYHRRCFQCPCLL